MGHDFDIWLGIRNWKIEAMERQVWREGGGGGGGEEEEKEEEEEEEEL